MKQSAAKKLGVAVLGAAFAATAAGTASAAPVPQPATPDPLALASKLIPGGQSLAQAPQQATQALGQAPQQATEALGQGAKTLPGALGQQNLQGEVGKQTSSLPLDGVKSGLGKTPLGSVGGLLGGLPLKGLPIGGLF
ncbi:hypothetical protein AB0C52_18135 [Streptomyces sp. NPDC048717]|uniref:hypothetical protein n=1 Tax=unclassified Streptomyces TaxID=2593676 RepID=UPI00342B4D83